MSTLENETVASHTYHIMQADSKEGKAFLRKVVRDHDNSVAGWVLRANPRTDWFIQFERTIKGEIGEPEREVLVRTDIKVILHGKFGGMQQSFSDAKPVQVNTPRQVHLSNSDAATFCELILAGFTPQVYASAGSTNSSAYGLAFYHFTMQKGWHRGVEMGGHTVTKDGRVLCFGTVSVD